MLNPEPRTNSIALGAVLIVIGLLVAATVWLNARPLNPHGSAAFGPNWRCSDAPRAHVCVRVDTATDNGAATDRPASRPALP